MTRYRHDLEIRAVSLKNLLCHPTVAQASFLQSSIMLTAIKRRQDPWLVRMEVDALHALAARKKLALNGERTVSHLCVFVLSILPLVAPNWSMSSAWSGA